MSLKNAGLLLDLKLWVAKEVADIAATGHPFL